MSLPIVLIHGFPFDSGMWKGQAAFLRARGRTVLTPDLPGFGASAALEQSACSMEAFAGAVRELIVRQCGGRAIVGGLSMGGYVLLALLRNWQEVVAGAMLIDTRADADTAEVRDGRLKAIEGVKAHGVGPLAETMLAKVFSKHATPAVRDQAREIMLRQSPAGVKGAQWAMAQRADQTSLLAQIKVPTLVVVGAEDAVTPPGVAMAIHGLIAGSMLVQVAQAGHMSNMEQPEAVDGAMEGFLGAVKR
jgi:3-oxoadipate enol-lactonase